MAWWVLDSLLAGDGHAIFVQPKGQLSVAYFCRNEHTKCPFCIQALCLKKKANKVSEGIIQIMKNWKHFMIK